MSTRSYLLLAACPLILASCQSAPSQQASRAPEALTVPTATQQVEAAPLPATPAQTATNPADAARMAYLESRIATLESQMSAAQPTLQKAEAMETHFRALSLELDRIQTTYKLSGPATPAATSPTPVEAQKPVPYKEAQAAPAKKKTAPENDKSKNKSKEKSKEKKQDKPEPKAKAGSAVTGIRIGQQKNGTTRLVLDTTRPAEIHYDLDNNEGILVIDLPGNAWAAAQHMAPSGSPLVKSFDAHSDKAGAHLVVQLKKKARVSATARLSPSGDQGHRVYLDITEE